MDINNKTSQKVLTIALVGIPNAGKSTLLNALIGESLAPTHHKPQMTRRNLLGLYSDNNYQLIFIDTPGMHKARSHLNKKMMTEFNQAINDADLVCVLVEAHLMIPDVINSFVNEWGNKKPICFVLNKIDKPKKEHKINSEVLNKYSAKVFAVSALKKSGIDELMSYFKLQAKDHAFFYNADDLTTSSVRELVVDYIREQTMEYLHDEIPYEVGVIIESFKENPKNVSVSAMIVVNKESQKGMVIGKKGQTIASIRRGSIQKIKELMGCPVRLSLFVKVDKNWIKNDMKINDYF